MQWLLSAGLDLNQINEKKQERILQLNGPDHGAGSMSILEARLISHDMRLIRALHKSSMGMWAWCNFTGAVYDNTGQSQRSR